jgi:hypothetical protein
LLAQDSENMQCLMDAIQEFETWSGIPVNTEWQCATSVSGLPQMVI